MPRQVLAFSGLHRNGHPLTEADLAQVAEMGNAQGSAPLTFGHVRGDAIRYGSAQNFATGPYTDPISGASVTGLFADLDFLDAVRPHVEAGTLAQRSIGIRRDPKGRLYPHHVALLGAQPPAVPGLPDLVAFDAGGTDLAEIRVTLGPAGPLDGTQADAAADFRDGSPLTRVLSNEIDRLADTDAYADRDAVIAALAAEAEVEAATVQHILDGDIPYPRLEWLRAFARALGIAEQTLVDVTDFWFSYARPALRTAPAPSSSTPPAPMPADPTPTPTGAADFSDTDEYRALVARAERADARHKQGQLDTLRTAATEATDAATAERIVAFADALVPAGSDALDFADGDDATRSAEPIAELTEIVRSLGAARNGTLTSILNFSTGTTDAEDADAKAAAEAATKF